MGLLFIIAWPISKLLDLLLGHSHATFFRRAELKELVDIHLKEDDESNEEPLTLDESRIIKGIFSSPRNSLVALIIHYDGTAEIFETLAVQQNFLVSNLGA